MDQITSNRGDNPENDLYQAWKEASAEARPQVEKHLLPHLRSHASKVCWMVFHSYQPDLVTEIVDDACMELHKFRGESRFSTWFHGRATNRARRELRRLKQRREAPLFAEFIKTYQPSNQHQGALIQDILKQLTEEDRLFVKRKIELGLSDEEISVEMAITRQMVQRIWSRIRRRLRVMYGGKAS